MTEKTVEEKLAIGNFLVACLNAKAAFPKSKEVLKNGQKVIEYYDSFEVSALGADLQEATRNKLARLIIELAPEPPQPVVSEEVENKA